MRAKQITPLTSIQRKELKEAFDALDVESSGFIDIKDMKVALRALGFEPKKDEVKTILNHLDKQAAQEDKPPRISNGMGGLRGICRILFREDIFCVIFGRNGVQSVRGGS